MLPHIPLPSASPTCTCPTPSHHLPHNLLLPHNSPRPHTAPAPPPLLHRPHHSPHSSTSQPSKRRGRGLSADLDLDSLEAASSALQMHHAAAAGHHSSATVGDFDEQHLQGLLEAAARAASAAGLPLNDTIQPFLMPSPRTRPEGAKSPAHNAAGGSAAAAAALGAAYPPQQAQVQVHYAMGAGAAPGSADDAGAIFKKGPAVAANAGGLSAAAGAYQASPSSKPTAYKLPTAEESPAQQQGIMMMWRNSAASAADLPAPRPLSAVQLDLTALPLPSPQTGQPSGPNRANGAVPSSYAATYSRRSSTGHGQSSRLGSPGAGSPGAAGGSPGSPPKPSAIYQQLIRNPANVGVDDSSPQSRRRTTSSRSPTRSPSSSGAAAHAGGQGRVVLLVLLQCHATIADCMPSLLHLCHHLYPAHPASRHKE
jgi:hypothetical protein